MEMYSHISNIPTRPETINRLLTTRNYLIIINDLDQLQIRDVNTLEEIDFEINDKNLGILRFCNFSNNFYIGKPGGIIEVWNIRNKSLESEIKTSIEQQYMIKCNKDYLIVSGDFSIEILERKNGKLIKTIKNPSLNYSDRFGEISVSDSHLACKIEWGKIIVWNLTSFKQEAVFTKEKSISCFLIKDAFLLIGTDKCRDDDTEDCTLNIWDFQQSKLVKKLGGWLQDDYYFDLKIRKPFADSPPQILALGADNLDIWEWGTWKHITRIEKIPWAQNCELYQNHLFISDVNGDIQIWKKKNNPKRPSESIS